MGVILDALKYVMGRWYFSVYRSSKKLRRGGGVILKQVRRRAAPGKLAG